MRKKDKIQYLPKSGVGAAPPSQKFHTSAFIDKYTAFLESQGKRPQNFDTLEEFKNTEYFKIKNLVPTMPPITDEELLATVDNYIRIYRISELTKEFTYPTPSSFFAHYFDIRHSKEFKKGVEDYDVEQSLSDPQIKEQIEFILEHLTLAWGDKFPFEIRVRLLARSFANFDKFCQTDEFQKLPESFQSQFSRFQTVRNFYRYVEKNPQISEKSPVMTVGYLRSLVKQYKRGYEETI